MNVMARGLAGLMIGLFFGASLWAHAQKVHAWIANEAAKFYEEQYGTHELMSYLGTDVENPSDAEETLWDPWEIGCSHLDENSWIGKSFMEGAWEEDTTWLWYRHYVEGGDSDKLTRGLLRQDLDLTIVSIPSQIVSYWVDSPYVVSDSRYASAYVAADDVYGRAALAYSQDKDLAYYFLGRVAHLLADMTVPAHTHNDRHWPAVDYYENTTAEYDYYKLYTTQTVGSRPLGTTPQYDTLLNLFGTTADYTEEYRSWGCIGEVGGFTVWSQSAGEPGDDEPGVLGIPNEYGGFLDPALLQLRHRPWVVNDLTGGQLNNLSAYNVMADDLMPFAIEQTTALIKFFYSQVDNTPPGAGIISWTSNLSSTETSPTQVGGGSVSVRITGFHPTSGVDKDGYSFTRRLRQKSN